MTSRLSLGAEFNPSVMEILPTLNWIIHTESEKMPLVSFGTSSDRIFTDEGNRAYFVTIAKGLPGTQIAPYFSFNYSEYERGWNFPFGLNLGIHERWDLLPMYDGRRSHLLLTYKSLSMNTTFMLIDLRKPRLGISVGFGF